MGKVADPRKDGGMGEAAGPRSFGSGLAALLRRAAMLVAAAAGFLAVLGLLLWGCATAVERGSDPPERHDAEVRCPWFERAEVELGGYGDPDYCIRIDAEGRQYGESVVAGPYD